MSTESHDPLSETFAPEDIPPETEFIELDSAPVRINLSEWISIIIAYTFGIALVSGLVGLTIDTLSKPFHWFTATLLVVCAFPAILGVSAMMLFPITQPVSNAFRRIRGWLLRRHHYQLLDILQQELSLTPAQNPPVASECIEGIYQSRSVKILWETCSYGNWFTLQLQTTKRHFLPKLTLAMPQMRCDPSEAHNVPSEVRKQYDKSMTEVNQHAIAMWQWQYYLQSELPEPFAAFHGALSQHGWQFWGRETHDGNTTLYLFTRNFREDSHILLNDIATWMRLLTLLEQEPKPRDKQLVSQDFLRTVPLHEAPTTCSTQPPPFSLHRVLCGPWQPMGDSDEDYFQRTPYELLLALYPEEPETWATLSNEPNVANIHLETLCDWNRYEWRILSYKLPQGYQLDTPNEPTIGHEHDLFLSEIPPVERQSSKNPRQYSRALAFCQNTTHPHHRLIGAVAAPFFCTETLPEILPLEASPRVWPDGQELIKLAIPIHGMTPRQQHKAFAHLQAAFHKMSTGFHTRKVSFSHESMQKISTLAYLLAACEHIPVESRLRSLKTLFFDDKGNIAVSREKDDKLVIYGGLSALARLDATIALPLLQQLKKKLRVKSLRRYANDIIKAYEQTGETNWRERQGGVSLLAVDGQGQLSLANQKGELAIIDKDKSDV